MKKTLLLLFPLFLLSFSSLPYPSSQEVQKVTLLRDQTWIIEISTSEVLHLQQVKEMKQSSYQYEKKKKKDFYSGQMIIVYKDAQSQLPIEVLSSSAIYKVLNTNDRKN